MCDIKDALPVLCKYINSLINVDLTAEHLRSAKYNTSDQNTADTLWNTLHILSYYAAREKRNDIDFRNYDTPSAVKLHLAFLQYPTIEFYSLSQSDKNSRQLLIALAWLLGTQDVLAIPFQIKLASSALGAECSHVEPSESMSLNIPNDQPLSTNSQLDNIQHLNTKVNLNLKEISELIREKGRLISKVHVASIDVSGLPHLNVSELALTKRLTMNNKNSEENRQRLREFRNAGIMLDARAKWLRKRHVFFDWMGTVIQEHQTSMETSRNIDLRELVMFNSLLHRVIKKKLQVLASENPEGEKSGNSALICPSRTYRSQCNNTQAENWLDDLNERQNCEGKVLEKNRKRLTDELKELLKLMPSIIRV